MRIAKTAKPKKQHTSAWTYAVSFCSVDEQMRRVGDDAYTHHRCIGETATPGGRVMGSARKRHTFPPSATPAEEIVIGTNYNTFMHFNICVCT